jgi:hypothetical protein
MLTMRDCWMLVADRQDGLTVCELVAKFTVLRILESEDDLYVIRHCWLGLESEA